MRNVQGDAIGTVRGAQANPPASHSHSAIAADHSGFDLLAANRATIRCTRLLVHFSQVNPSLLQRSRPREAAAEPSGRARTAARSGARPPRVDRATPHSRGTRAA